MSIAERKLEEKQEMTARILNGARKVFLDKGYESTSMRNIAAEINYSPGSIYFYFKDKNEIFHELHAEGFRLLLSKIKVLDSVKDPFERLKASGRVFMQFAKEHKDYYNLMFIVKESRNSEKPGYSIGEETISHIASIISECQKQGRFTDMDTDYFTFMIISVVHGICALYCKDRISSFSGITNDELMEHGYDCMVKLMEK